MNGMSNKNKEYDELESLTILYTAYRCANINEPEENLMSETDFNEYLDLCYAEYKRAGIDDKRGREYIPEAESRELYKQTEKLLVEYGIDIIPDEMTEKETLRNAVKITKYRDRVLELVLALEC
jgi:hypothetical protein